MSETNKFVCYHSKYESSWMHVRPADESERSDEWTNQNTWIMCMTTLWLKKSGNGQP